jgi:hypothetical protein
VTITEETRYQLYKQLEDTLGAEHASTLMEHLPPVGWGDVATKADLAQLEERMNLRFEAALANGLHRQFVQTIASVAALLTVMLSLAVTVNQLLAG